MHLTNHYAIISAHCHQGQKKNGVDLGPTFLKPLFENTQKIKCWYAINENEFSLEPTSENNGYVELFRLHTKLLENDYIPIVLGGDHSIGHETVGSFIQKYEDDILIIWIDAHADINTLAASKSKNTHGTPLSGLIGLEPVRTTEIKKLLKPENLAYYGIRDLDKFEMEVIEKYKPNIIKRHSYEQLIELVSKYNNVHISFDVDALDASYVDSTGTTATDGITPDEVVKCLKIAGKKLRGIDIVEFNPKLGSVNNSLSSIKYIVDAYFLEN
jgi:arginase